jgi:DNA-directed RNA polymerase specialized sigma24 family protein
MKAISTSPHTATRPFKTTPGRLHLKIRLSPAVPGIPEHPPSAPDEGEKAEALRDWKLCHRARSGDINVLERLVRSCVARASHWKLPPNWCNCDWSEEVHAMALGIAWRASCQYDAGRGTRFEAFVQSCVRSKLLARYRRESNYGRRGVSLYFEDRTKPDGLLLDLEFESGETEGGSTCEGNPAWEALHDAVESLPAPDRRLVVAIFFEGSTEAELARERHLGQPAISKHKQSILSRLRNKLAVQSPIEGNLAS